MTIQTCTTADLDRLCRQYSNPRTLEESAILFGVKTEQANRLVESVAVRVPTRDSDELPSGPWLDSREFVQNEADALRA